MTRVFKADSPNSTSKGINSLLYDHTIIKELTLSLIESGWEYEAEQFSLLFLKDKARIMYFRRTEIIQIYWAGYGHLTREAKVFDFQSIEDLLRFTQQLYEMELIPMHHIEDPEDMDDIEGLDTPIGELSPFDIIRSIFS